jgi:hypothetical protein
MAIADVALSWAHVTSTVARDCYQMITIATGEDMMSLKIVATEVHNSDGRFGDITDESL